MIRLDLLHTLLTVASMTAACGWVSTASAIDWPQWQGPDRNAVSKESGLLQEWPNDGPSLAWKATGIGKGMGGMAVSGGRIYTTGDDEERTAWLYALNESDGKAVWSARSDPAATPETSLSRSAPAPPRRWTAIGSTSSARLGTLSASQPKARKSGASTTLRTSAASCRFGAFPNRRWSMATSSSAPLAHQMPC